MKVNLKNDAIETSDNNLYYRAMSHIANNKQVILVDKDYEACLCQYDTDVVLSDHLTLNKQWGDLFDIDPKAIKYPFMIIDEKEYFPLKNVMQLYVFCLLYNIHISYACFSG